MSSTKAEARRSQVRRSPKDRPAQLQGYLSLLTTKNTGLVPYEQCEQPLRLRQNGSRHHEDNNVSFFRKQEELCSRMCGAAIL